MSQKYVFAAKRGESFQFTEARMNELIPKLIEASDAVQELHSFVRVHPQIKKFCADAWDEMAQRLSFETRRPYAECSREVARRHRWVYLAHGEQGEHRVYDVDLTEVQS